MTFLRYWLIGTAIVVTGLAVWAIAPILVFLVLLTGVLGLLCWGIVALAHGLKGWSERR